MCDLHSNERMFDGGIGEYTFPSFICFQLNVIINLSFRTAAQVFGFANMRKVSLGETGESSGSDDGRSGSRIAKYTDYVRPSAFDTAGGGMDGGNGGLAKFPTFYPRAGGLLTNFHF